MKGGERVAVRLNEEQEQQLINSMLTFISRVSAGQYQYVDEIVNLPEMTKLMLEYSMEHTST